MELKGSRRVEIVGISDKCQITAVICGSMSGDLLPFQLIYQGKTKTCLPQYEFPDDWHITCTSNHWSNKGKAIEYIEKIIIPYVRGKHLEIELSVEHPALAIFDVFKGQVTEKVFSVL